jgi:ankyrin repeat protein
VLLEHGANVAADVAAEDNEGRTPLNLAAEGWSVDVVRVLLVHGANVAAEGRSPF